MGRTLVARELDLVAVFFAGAFLAAVFALLAAAVPVAAYTTT